ncbi:MAG: LysM peptidoglycan-binding domain-containing protein [Rudaea sp.]
MKARSRHLLEALSLLLVLAVLLPAALPASAHAMSLTSTPQMSPAAAPFACSYVVRPGDDLFRIGLRFGVSYLALANANGITNFNLIFSGMVLRVPCAVPTPSPTVCNIHIVQRGEWLALIAANFGVTWQSIAALNHLANPNVIFVGQRLLIPCSSTIPVAPISITMPVSGQSVCSPVAVSGRTTLTPFEASLRGRVLNEEGVVVGQASIHVNAPMGQPGPFSGSIAFDTSRVRNGSTGRIDVSDISPRDGSVNAIASRAIRFSCGF